MKQVKGANYRLLVRPSPIQGDGVFAGEDIPWGRKILEYRGALIDDKEAARRIADGANAIMDLGGGQNIDGFDNTQANADGALSRLLGELSEDVRIEEVVPTPTGAITLFRATLARPAN